MNNSTSMGLSLHSSTTSSDLLKQFVMDPTTFTSASAQDRFLRTPLGLRLGESQRLLGLAQNLADLRQQMMGEALTRMNMEGVEGKLIRYFASQNSNFT